MKGLSHSVMVGGLVPSMSDVSAKSLDLSVQPGCCLSRGGHSLEIWWPIAPRQMEILDICKRTYTIWLYGFLISPLMTYPGAISIILRESQDGLSRCFVEWLRPLYATMSITMMTSLQGLSTFCLCSHTKSFEASDFSLYMYILNYDSLGLWGHWKLNTSAHFCI